MLCQSFHAWHKMTAKSFYEKVMFPFTVRRQERLRESRLNQTFEKFLSEFPASPIREKFVNKLWDFFRECALVNDFRPCPDDDIEYIYKIDIIELLEDYVAFWLEDLGYDLEKFDFSKYDINYIRTPLDIYKLVLDMESAIKFHMGKEGRFLVAQRKL